MTNKRTTAAWALLEHWESSGAPTDLIAQLTKLADEDDIDAITVLVGIYEDGLRDRAGRSFVGRDARAATRLLERGVQLGDPNLITGLADRLTESRRVSPASWRRGLVLYRRAARTGYATAAYNLGCAYRNRGQHRDAVTWFRRAWALGDASALFEVARAELYGVGTRRDVHAALDKLRRVTRSKITYIPTHWLQCEAMLLLSTIFEDGWLVVRDYNASMRWLRRAAGLGSPKARAMLRS